MLGLSLCIHKSSEYPFPLGSLLYSANNLDMKSLDSIVKQIYHIYNTRGPMVL